MTEYEPLVYQIKAINYFELSEKHRCRRPHVVQIQLVWAAHHVLEITSLDMERILLEQGIHPSSFRILRGVFVNPYEMGKLPEKPAQLRVQLETKEQAMRFKLAIPAYSG